MGDDKSSKSNERKKMIRRQTDLEHDAVLGMLVDMITHPEEWRFES